MWCCNGRHCSSARRGLLPLLYSLPDDQQNRWDGHLLPRLTHWLMGLMLEYQRHNWLPLALSDTGGFHAHGAGRVPIIEGIDINAAPTPVDEQHG